MSCCMISFVNPEEWMYREKDGLINMIKYSGVLKRYIISAGYLYDKSIATHRTNVSQVIYTLAVISARVETNKQKQLNRGQYSYDSTVCSNATFFPSNPLELFPSLEYNSRDLSISPMLKLLYLT